MKFPIVLGGGYTAEAIEVEVLTCGEVLTGDEVPCLPDCPTCGRSYGGVRSYVAAAQQALATITARCAGGYYDALRDAIYAYEREHGRATW